MNACGSQLTAIKAADGSRQPTALELELATIQGETFGNHIKVSYLYSHAKNGQLGDIWKTLEASIWSFLELLP
jgi:hypothetical protein